MFWLDLGSPTAGSGGGSSNVGKGRGSCLGLTLPNTVAAVMDGCAAEAVHVGQRTNGVEVWLQDGKLVSKVVGATLPKGMVDNAKKMW